MMNEVLNKNYSLKILFGPMFGCELNLPENDYFLIINSAMNSQSNVPDAIHDGEHAAFYTSNTLYIPCDLLSPNISLYLSDNHQDDEGNFFLIEVHDEHGNNYKSSLRENAIFTHEHIKFAVKKSDSQWSDEIQNYHSSSVSTVTENKSSTHCIKKNRVIALFSVLIISVVCLYLIFLTYYKVSLDQQIISLNEALSGAPNPLEVVKGRENDNIYILAHKYRDMEWARESLKKIQHDGNLLLISLSDDKKNIIDDLLKIGYPALQLSFTSTQHATLAIYRTLNPQEEMHLRYLILQKIPYATNVDFIVKTKEQLLNDAKQGLDKLNVHYRLIKNASGYSFIIRDALSDNMLNSLHDFISKFTQQWGNTVISFSINLDENWLTNKSYVDSAKGYLFLNPRHWYFPLNNKEF